MKIDPVCSIHPSAELGEDVAIGAFCVIEEGVKLGAGCRLESHVVIKKGSTLGPDNHVFEGAVLGGIPQHTSLPDELGSLVIGAGNTLRENVTIHRSMIAGGQTTIGDDCLIMAGAHVAHDCHLGNQVIIANNTLMAGHVAIDDSAFLSGAVAVHQFCRVGRLAMVGGHSRILKDVPPFVTVDGETSRIVGLNLIGLRRNGFSRDRIGQLKSAYRLIYRSGLAWREMLEALKEQFTEDVAAEFHPFFLGGQRGFTQERRMPPGATLKLRDEGEAETVLRKKAG